VTTKLQALKQAVRPKAKHQPSRRPTQPR
jgi:hypothetical protein